VGIFKRAFDRLKSGLTKTRKRIKESLDSLLVSGRKIDESLLEDLGDVLISADIGVVATDRILDDLRNAYKEGRIEKADQIIDFLKADLKNSWPQGALALNFADKPPTVILVAGVNGTGKTTSVAKIAKAVKDQGKTVLLAAADTFRAAAVEQLTIWSDRLDLPIVKHKMGADPGAVAFDACEAAISRNTDVLLIDTAGRLHTQENLMRELAKIRNIVAKKIPGAPHEVLLVLDATTGQNAIQQAKMFKQAIDVTGIFLAKLDGTAKGGIVVAIRDQLDLPVKLVGVGESPEDVEPFDPENFVEALFG
jgi:fused signal recognition particle receptor